MAFRGSKHQENHDARPKPTGKRSAKAYRLDIEGRAATDAGARVSKGVCLQGDQHFGRKQFNNKLDGNSVLKATKEQLKATDRRKQMEADREGKWMYVQALVTPSWKARARLKMAGEAAVSPPNTTMRLPALSTLIRIPAGRAPGGHRIRFGLVK